jgi:hypothetical protein
VTHVIAVGHNGVGASSPEQRGTARSRRRPRPVHHRRRVTRPRPGPRTRAAAGPAHRPADQTPAVIRRPLLSFNGDDEVFRQLRKTCSIFLGRRYAASFLISEISICYSIRAARRGRQWAGPALTSPTAPTVFPAHRTPYLAGCSFVSRPSPAGAPLPAQGPDVGRYRRNSHAEYSGKCTKWRLAIRYVFAKPTTG